MMSVTQNYTKHFLTLNEFEDDRINKMIQRALEFKTKSASLDLSNNYAVNLFFEDSTRTHKSFEMAERKSGMHVLEFTPETSSLKKGETLYDTVKTFEAIGVDMIVIRHSQEAFYNDLLERSDLTCSIINGGDGAGQHPSQSLLDLMTIYEEFHTFENLKIAIAGDIRHSRVAKSNAMILTRLGAEVIFTGPTDWMDPSLAAFGKYSQIDDCISDVDVFMLLRVQHERHDKAERSFSKQAYLEQYGLTAEREQRMSDHAIIMHPAPVNRGVEIANELVECNRSRIFQQMANGVYARMAILEYVLNKS